jgi:PTS system nitrogen regulatory IIA component
LFFLNKTWGAAMQLTLRETAQLLRVSEKTVLKWAGTGHMPVSVVDGDYRFNRSELLEWATERHQWVTPAAYEGGTPSTGASSVARALEAGGIHYGVMGTTKAEILAHLVETATLPPAVDRDTVYRLLMAREQLGGTAIGHGIAIPHVRYPIVLAVTAPLISLWYLATPFAADTPDGAPIETLFFLISPTVHSHIAGLSRLAALLHDAGFAAAVARRATAATILAEARRAEPLIAEHLPAH